MRIARLLDGGAETFGLVRDGRVATREEMVLHTGVPVPEGVGSFLFDGWYGEVSGMLGGLGYARSLEEFEVMAPLPRPGKIMCLAFNYADHAGSQGLSPPRDPVIVLKPRTALAGAGADIVCPGFVSKLDFEIELAVIIGEDCRDVSPEAAERAIFGYMIFNDVTARDIQEADGQFGRAKGFDTFAPCGPWITTADEAGDVGCLGMRTRVNGNMRQEASTAGMSVRVPEIISSISRSMTLEKGDVISTGTPAGTALDDPSTGFLKDGDVIEMEIEGLGSLCNTVRRA